MRLLVKIISVVLFLIGAIGFVWSTYTDNLNPFIPLGFWLLGLIGLFLSSEWRSTVLKEFWRMLETNEVKLTHEFSEHDASRFGRKTGNRMRLNIIPVFVYGMFVLIFSQTYIQQNFGILAGIAFLFVFWLGGASLLFMTVLAVRCPSCTANVYYPKGGPYNPFWATKFCRECKKSLP